MQDFDNLHGITNLRQKTCENFVYFAYIAFYICFLSMPLLAQELNQEKRGGIFLESSISQVLLLRTIESDIRMDVNVEDIEYSARGRYEEQALPKPLAGEFLRSMYRLDINFVMNTPATSGTEPNRMTVVCHLEDDREKNQIWKYTSIEGTKTMDIIKVAPVENAIKASKKFPKFVQISEVRNLGGLAGQLRQISQVYDFPDPPQTEKLEQEGESVDVWKLIGTMQQTNLDVLVKQYGGIDKKKRYPPELPTDIELWIGQKTGFPYKIRYLNRPSENSPKRTQLFQSSYFNIILNGEAIPPTRFATFDQSGYPEGLFPFQDITNTFIRSLGL